MPIAADAPSAPVRRPAGRQRDEARDAVILDATLAVLADQGFDRMTIDAVAAAASTVRATVYRRWPTKADLVLAAVARLSAGDVDLARLPDTGSLRGDIVAMTRDFDDEQQRIRMHAVLALLAMARSDERLAEAVTAASIGPWIAAGRLLIARAVERGEFPSADVDALAQVIPMMCLARAAQHLPITREWTTGLLDGVLLPALRAG